MKFSVKDFFSKCDQIPGAFTEEILMENFIHYALYGIYWNAFMQCSLNKFLVMYNQKNNAINK